MRLHRTARPGPLAVATALAVVLASCGASDDADDAAGGGVVELPSASADEGTPAPSPAGDGPTREVVDDGPDAFVDQLGCTMAPDEATVALLETVTGDVELAPAVATPVPDEQLGGLAIGAMVLDDDRTVTVWHWDPDGAVLRPVTPEALALAGDDADASLVPEPGAGGAIVWTGELGVPVAQDCALFVGRSVLPPPTPSEPPVRDDLLVVAPATVAPGAVVEVTFPDGHDRGIAYELRSETSPGTWEVAWWMTSDANGGEPTTVPVGTEGWGHEDVGISGTGPDRVLIANATDPGVHRLCTANAVEDICGTVTVVDRR